MTGPRVILDVDGVVADFVPHLLQAIGYEGGAETITDYDLRKFLTLAQQERMDQTLAQGEFWHTLPVIEGALEGIDEIREQRHEIIWATSPWVACPNWEGIRREWLYRHFDVDPSEIVFTFQKQLLTAEFFIDDSPEAVVAWQRAHSRGRAVLYSAPHNASFVWPQRLTWQLELAEGEQSHEQEDAQDAIREREG